MTLKEVRDHLEKNANKPEYIADKLTSQGYGQTTGAYFNEAKKRQVAKPTQKWHFIEAYCGYKKDDAKITFSRIYCPQLLIWIAEVAGLDESIIEEAKDFVICYEDENNKKETEKSANYIKPTKTYDKPMTEFRTLLHIYDINRIVKESANWTEVMEKVSKIKK